MDKQRGILGPDCFGVSPEESLGARELTMFGKSSVRSASRLDKRRTSWPSDCAGQGSSSPKAASGSGSCRPCSMVSDPKGDAQ